MDKLVMVVFFCYILFQVRKIVRYYQKISNYCCGENILIYLKVLWKLVIFIIFNINEFLIFRIYMKNYCLFKRKGQEIQNKNGESY